MSLFHYIGTIDIFSGTRSFTTAQVVHAGENYGLLFMYAVDELQIDPGKIF